MAREIYSLIISAVAASESLDEVSQEIEAEMARYFAELLAKKGVEAAKVMSPQSNRIRLCGCGESWHPLCIPNGWTAAGKPLEESEERRASNE